MRHSALYTAFLTSAVLFTATFAAPARAQDEAPPTPPPAIDSTIYMKAFDMVSNGDPEDGRELIDSLLKASKEGTPKYAEGLYWRARLASMGPSAERDYRRIIVDYPLTSRAPDALLKLGQLELTRGDRDAAEGHFKRIISDYETSRVYAEANYWLARSYFDMNKTQSACKVNAEALAKVNPANIELKNQIDFQNQQCRGLALSDSAATDADEASAKVPAKPPKKLTAAQKAAATKAEKAEMAKAAAAKKKKVPVVDEAASNNDEMESTPADSAGADDGEHAVPHDSAADEAPVKKPVVKTAATKTAAAKTATAAAGKKVVYMVQVAAYQTKEQAVDMAQTLKSRGYSAHVDGTKAPFRVRVGRFTTRAGAADLLAKLRDNQVALDAFVTEE